MELRDYVAALRRHWRAWVALTGAGLLVALAVILTTPPTYRATAGVFVGSTLEGTSGSQFVNQRVRSYPDIAVSRAVLEPVIDRLLLAASVRELRAGVAADNPVDTSQIDISVTARSPEQAAEIANAVAAQFGRVVEDLEAPPGKPSPVDLTVTDPAIAPTAQHSPDVALLLTLGLVVGLSLGLAVAIVRSRMDTAVYTAEDVRRAWGEDDGHLVVHASQGGGRRRARTPEEMLVGQLETLAERSPLSVVLVPLRADRLDAVRARLAEVARQLTARGVPAAVRSADDGSTADAGRPAVELDVAELPAALRDWRDLQARSDGIVVVVESGSTPAAEVADLRSAASTTGIRPMALMLVGRRYRPGRQPDGGPSPVVRRPGDTGNQGRPRATATIDGEPAVLRSSVASRPPVPVGDAPAGELRTHLSG